MLFISSSNLTNLLLMPIRSRSHILEDESKEHIKSLLPSHWVFRQMESDYGSDGLVEIWDLAPNGKDAFPTGLFFNIQLKATDSSKTATQKKLSVKAGSFDYWMSQVTPTLLIRYATNKGKPIAYFCWNYDGKLKKTKAGRSYGISFQEDNIWGTSTPDRIQESLTRDQVLNSINIELPIILDFINKKDNREVESILRDKLAPFSDLVKMRNPTSGESVIDVNSLVSS